MIYRIRKAMTNAGDGELGGAGAPPVEIDEMLIGGKIKRA
jgi:hypothetical protein